MAKTTSFNDPSSPPAVAKDRASASYESKVGEDVYSVSVMEFDDDTRDALRARPGRALLASRDAFLKSTGSREIWSTKLALPGGTSAIDFACDSAQFAYRVRIMVRAGRIIHATVAGAGRRPAAADAFIELLWVSAQ